MRPLPAPAAPASILSEAQAAGRELLGAIDLPGRVDRHPYGMVAAAIGIGYVLGGGLFTRTTSRVVRLGLKLAALPIVSDHLLNYAEAALDGALARRRAAGPTPPDGST